MGSANFKATLIVFLAITTASTATDCGDVSDGSVTNCCDAEGGICTNCDVNYGLSNDKTKCVKCKDPKCSVCPGNPAVCKSLIYPPIPNCARAAYDNSACYECYDGFGQTGAAGDRQCRKCSANCLECDGPKLACKFCTGGFSTVLGGKECVRCKTSNCRTCSTNLASCTQCNGDFGLTGGKCVKCPTGAETCNAGQLVCRRGFGTFGAPKGRCRRCADKNCIKCDKSVCDECDVYYDNIKGNCTYTLPTG